MDPKDNEVVIADEVDLDEDFEKDLDAELAKLSGKEAEHEDVEQVSSSKTAEQKSDDNDSDESAEETTSQSPTPEESQNDDPNKELVEGFKAPVKGKFESDESFSIRKQLADLVLQRKSATSDEERQAISQKINSTRKEFSNLNNGNGINRSQSSNDDNASPHVQSQDGTQDGDSSQKRPATIEDIERVFEEREMARGVSTTLESFIGRHPELQDEDTRQVYFDFVDANYNWQGKVGKDLMTVLELARENMFKPSETISERVLKSAGVQQKVNAMQFPGGSVVGPSYTPEQQKSIDELKDLGYSEKDALDMITV